MKLIRVKLAQEDSGEETTNHLIVSSKYKKTITEPQIKILQWLVSSKLYFIFFIICVLSPILTYSMCVMDTVMKNSPGLVSRL